MAHCAAKDTTAVRHALGLGVRYTQMDRIESALEQSACSNLELEA
jgi:hypothetical protein